MWRACPLQKGEEAEEWTTLLLFSHDHKRSQEHSMNLSKQRGVSTSRVNYAVSVMIMA